MKRNKRKVGLLSIFGSILALSIVGFTCCCMSFSWFSLDDGSKSSEAGTPESVDPVGTLSSAELTARAQRAEKATIHFGDDRVDDGEKLEGDGTPNSAATTATDQVGTLEPAAISAVSPSLIASPTTTPMPSVTPNANPVSMGMVTVRNAQVNLRNGPGLEYEISGAARAGDRFNVYRRNEDGSWLQIDQSGRWWISASIVVFDDDLDISVLPIAPTPTPTETRRPTATPDADAVVATANLNVREGPGTAYRVISQFEQGAFLTIIGVNQDRTWLKVRSGSRQGWVSASLCTVYRSLSGVQVINVPAPTGASQPQPQPQPTSPPAAAVCDCSGNVYNCANFGTQGAAQACYNYCLSTGRGDIHDLDRDNDGIACESLR